MRLRLLRVLGWAPVLAVLAIANAFAAGPRGRGEVLDFTPEEIERIAAHGPWPVAAPRDASNRVQGRADAEALGRRLFFDPGLSGDGRVSCASCHQPQRAFQDGRPTALGRAAGLRNTPGLHDVVLQRWFGWDGAHDSLWAASLSPLLDPAEMGSSAATVAGSVRERAALRTAYARVFGPPVDDDEVVLVNLAKALAAWQATLVSPRTAFDDFRDALLRGDRRAASRYPVEAQRGLRLFVGRASCSACHAGPTFSNGEFADIGRPFFVPGGVDAGRHAGLRRLLASRHNRLGPFSDAPPGDAGAIPTRHVMPEHRNFGEFRVPPLRMLAQTAPYTHDGSLATIEDVVRHYSRLDEERLHADGERILRRLDLTPGEEADLAAFLRSLSAPARNR